MPNEYNEQGQEKSEAPTGKRRTKAREKGNVARSKEINTAVLLFIFIVMMASYGPFIVRSLIEFISYWFTHLAQFDVSSKGDLGNVLLNVFWFYLKLVGPFLLVLMIAGIVANLAQFGWLWTKQTIFQGLSLGKLFSPTKAFSKIFNKGNVVNLGINLAKLAVLSVVIFSTLKKEFWTFPFLVDWPLYDSLVYMMKILFTVSLKVCVLLILVAIIDFMWEKHKHERSLKMTKQEVKDERKQMEGDPKIKAKVRGIMMKASIDRMMRNVPKADVVITNPVHVAVAIQYDQKVMGAPQIVAKGARLLAERIKEIARTASIPVIENRIVAQTLYKTVDVGQPIPEKMYQAVAEILAYVYNLNKMKRERAVRTPAAV